jgi:coiled-coil domain-containing protein 130
MRQTALIIVWLALQAITTSTPHTLTTSTPVLNTNSNMQGFNMGRYVPPDQEGVMSGNQLHSKHALGARANKISQGILTVRFEMPYPIWCTHCPKPTIIGQGVRFNAEKKKIGNYFSTPIFSFRMKHVACGGWIEIRTDPKNTAYVVMEGARKRDLGDDKVEEGDVKILTQEEREALRENAFAALEVKVEDKKMLEYSKKRLEELQDLSEKQWEDPYEKNKRLRDKFRAGRKQREKDSDVTSALQDKMSLGLDLLPEHEDDSKRASFIEFGRLDVDVDKAVSKPLFKHEDPMRKVRSRNSKVSKALKSADLAKQRKANIVAEIQDNTRVAMDPFLSSSRPVKTVSKIPGIRQKQENLEREPGPIANSLVDYDSD